MTPQSILTECRANPDKIFHILKKDRFVAARILWGSDIETILTCPNCHYYTTYHRYNTKIFCPNDHSKLKIERSPRICEGYTYHLKKLALEPDEIAYLEKFINLTKKIKAK